MDQRGISILIGFLALSVALGVPLGVLPRAKSGEEGGTTQKQEKEQEETEEKQLAPPPVDVWANAARVYGEFFGRTSEQADEAALREVLSDQANYRFKFLIALVPDPLDSQLPAGFDQALEGIQQAYADSGYLLDRVWLPWAENKAAE
ncbi:MAG: hypothetical protein ACJ76J_09185, partial [Thermoanaerobaculia bacterium]